MDEKMSFGRMGDGAGALLRRIYEKRGGGVSFDEFMRDQVQISEKERAEKLAADMNSKEGTLGSETYFSCPKCMNRGYFWTAREYMGSWQVVQLWCNCWKTRDSIQRMKRSGLANSLKRLKDFEAVEPYQKQMLDAAKAYLALGDHSGGESLFLGGAVGSGKTHIGTAVCRELLHREHAVIYMPWVNEAQRLKAMGNDEGLTNEIAVYSQAEYLYIDDLFKPLPGQVAPTPADFRLAYDIINYRYINKLPMIVSCEKYIDELLEYDEATVSRLYERAKGYTVNIGRVAGRNYRMKGADMIV